MRAARLIMAALISVPLGAMAIAQDQSPRSEATPPHEATAPEATPSQEATPGHSALQEGQTSQSCLGNITFSQEFLARYPRAGGACREVKKENGEAWARFDADVVRVRRNRITANFLDRYNNPVGTVTFDAQPDATIEVNGHATRFARLMPGDRLSFWMPESRVGFYAKPGTPESTKLAVVGTEPAQR